MLPSLGMSSQVVQRNTQHAIARSDIGGICGQTAEVPCGDKCVAELTVVQLIVPETPARPKALLAVIDVISSE